MDNWSEFTKTVRKLSAKKKRNHDKVIKNIEIKPDIKREGRLSHAPSEKIKSGKRPEAQIDLHGLSLEKAHLSLINFIKFSYENDFKFLLVITGKAKTSTQSTIRRELPIWLENPEISGLIKKYISADNKHGGEGAFYIKLY